MSTIIATGACKTVFLLECPICGDPFPLVDGVYLESATLADSVLVCCKHDMELTVDQEIAIQNALRRAVDSPDGFVSKDAKLVKKTAILEKYGVIKDEDI